MIKVHDYMINKWEYLPSYLLHFPTAFIYLFFSIKSKSFLFFTNISNDYKSSDIENSSKNSVYEKLDKNFYPVTALIRRDSIPNIAHIDIENEYGLKYPIIIKPNVGKRGLGAILINNKEDLIEYCKQADYDFLLQEYIDALNECGIFYIKYPNGEKARITSIGMKQLPTVVGDGVSNLKRLLEINDASSVTIDKLKERYDLNTLMLQKDEELIIEPIGAHCRGARITAANHLISEKLLNIIEHSIKGLKLYYGRLDIKYNTWQDLLNGEFKIIEVNTITSEPLNIYDRNVPILSKYKILYVHIKSMYEISAYLKKMGQPIQDLKSFASYIFRYRAHLKRISAAKV